EKHNSRIMLLTWAIAIVITGISGAWWWQNQQENSLAQLSAETAETEQVADDADIDQMSADELIASTPAEIAPVSAAPAVVSQADTAMSAAGDVTEPVVAATEEVTEEAAQEPVAVIEDAQETEEPAAPVVPEGMTLLTMKFKADCWIQVKDANGKTLVSGTRKPGQDVELAGKAPFKVILGAPEGVTMTFASEPVDLSGYTSGKVARFTLPL
ncbi:DUF4115 domain-containing protein, partial [Vibrio owensii]